MRTTCTTLPACIALHRLHLAACFGAGLFLATVEVDNERSIHLLERLGFALAAPEGITTLTPTERLYLR